MNTHDTSLANLRRRRGAKWQHYGADVLPAWVADMDFAPAPAIVAALEARITTGALGYPEAIAHSGLFELFAERVAARYGWHIDAGDVLSLVDVVQGLYLCLETLSERGDGVVIQTPIYPPFLHAVAETGRRAVSSPLVAGPAGYGIDFDALEAAIDDGTRVLMLCNPHNPSGRAFTAAELDRLADIACRHDLVVLSDEIHADLMLDPRPHLPIAARSPEVAARTVTLMSASKAFNIAGLCLAFAHFGSPALRARFERVPGHVRGATHALSVCAVEAAWREAQPWQDGIVRQLRANRDRVAAWVRERWPAIGHFAPEATYLAWFDLRALELPVEPYDFFLAEGRVALSPGRNFGPEGSGHVRLNFATPPAILEQILARMDAALGTR